jgi:hypothetical protein
MLMMDLMYKLQKKKKKLTSLGFSASWHAWHSDGVQNILGVQMFDYLNQLPVPLVKFFPPKDAGEVLKNCQYSGRV